MKSSKVQNRKFCYVVSSFLKHKNWDAFGAHYYILGFSNNRVRFGIYFFFQLSVWIETTTPSPKFHYKIIQQSISWASKI